MSRAVRWSVWWLGSVGLVGLVASLASRNARLSIAFGAAWVAAIVLDEMGVGR